MTLQKAVICMNGRFPNQHAWRRFLARMFDYLFFSFLFMVLISQAFLPAAYPVCYFIGQTIFVITLEALFVWRGGTTPGKRLLGLYIVSDEDAPLDLRRAWHRTFCLYLRGLWLALPIILFIPAWLSKRQLEATGTTSWDKAANTAVFTTSRNLFREILFVIVFLLLIYLISNFYLLQDFI